LNFVLKTQTFSRNAEEKTMKILQASEAFVTVDFVGIDLDIITQYEQFVLQLGKRNMIVQKDRTEERGVSNFIFVGKNKEGIIIYMSVLEIYKKLLKHRM
jgi:hypothetical protein